MNVLIVESQAHLGAIWKQHMERNGMIVTLVTGHDEAISHLTDHSPDIIILDLVLPDGNALAISDFASFRHPDARVIFVTNTSFFSDGSIFAHANNACAYVQSATPPEDLTAMVAHYAVAH
ncbi:response regulator [Ascidiaceihabitans sp.]|uniref:response regulator transcription factor n=1 Tax=Ascidiaceihabitans sp. TaxID=1872644 RepID=UPI003298B4B0